MLVNSQYSHNDWDMAWATGVRFLAGLDFLFAAESRQALEPTQRPLRWAPGHFPWGKGAGA
jgi:hypothetical protein